MHQLNNPDARQALKQLRMIWIALIAGQVFMAAILLGLMLTQLGTEGVMPAWRWPATAILALGLGVALALGLFVRGQFYKSQWRQSGVAPEAHRNGNIALLAMLEAVGTIALIGMLIVGVVPVIFVFAASLGLQIALFPPPAALAGAAPPQGSEPYDG